MAHLLAHRLTNGVIEKGHRPSAVLETAARIFLGTTWGLHHPIQCHERKDNQFSHASFDLLAGNVYQSRLRGEQKVIADPPPHPPPQGGGKKRGGGEKKKQAGASSWGRAAGAGSGAAPREAGATSG